MKVEGKIKAVSRIRDVQDKKQVGFTLESNSDFWYNLSGSEEELNKLKNSILMKGNEIGFEYDKLGRTIKGLVLREKAKEKPTEKPTEKTEDMTCFEDLLQDAHKKFKDNFSIETELIRDAEGNPIIDHQNKYALFKAKVIIGERVFTGYGDATEENTGELVKKHFIRMAETRSIVRALRFATNNAKVAKEEVGK